jgi:AcrR family transcriptional regulator
MPSALLLPIHLRSGEEQTKAMAESRIKGRILQAAIQLFGKFSFEGVTTRGLAKSAQCMEGGIYRLFGDKERLYDDAIASVVQASVSGMAEFALRMYTDKSKKFGETEIIKAAVHRWYSSLSQDGARLLQQILLNDKRRRPQAHQAFDNILAILQTTLEQSSKKPAKSFAPKTRSESLIWTLFQLKLSYSGTADKEQQEVDRYLHDWLLTVQATD